MTSSYNLTRYSRRQWKPPWRDDPTRCVPTHTGPTRPATKQSVADAIAKLTGAEPPAHER